LPSLAEIRAERARRKAEAERRTLAANIEQIRARCTSLAGFVREAWSVLEPTSTYIHGWHIDAICRHLEAITFGHFLALGLSNRLLINVPPGTMKSLIVSVFWPAWEWGPCGLAAMRYLTTSYSEKYVKRDSRRMRDLVQSEWYRSLWPEVELIRAGEASFANSKTGFREGVPFGSLTGGRGDRVIIDDPHSTETAESDAERENTTRIFRESVPTRVNDPTKSAIVVIMQRLHSEDVSGQIQKLHLGYVHLMLPMEFEPERACETPTGFRDPRTYEGELLFPERFPRATVERDKVPMGSFAVAGQYQQRPTPREGGLFKRSWFEIVDALPANIVKRGRGWDLAGTKAKRSDYTAGVRVCLSGDGIYYVEDLQAFKGTPAEVDRALKSAASQDPSGTSIHLPQDGGQAGVAQRDAHLKLLAGYDVRSKPVTGDKEQRARPAAAQAEAGNIKLLRGTWNERFLDEVCNFPAAPHDDIVDALSEAFNGVAGVSSGEAIMQFYRAEAQAAAAEAPASPFAKPKAAGTPVRMFGPPGISTAFGMTGTAYYPGADGIFHIAPDDVGPLTSAGFKHAAE